MDMQEAAGQGQWLRSMDQNRQSESVKRKSNISLYHLRRNRVRRHKQRVGALAPLAGFVLIVSFAAFLLPLFVYMLIFNKLYFWIRNQNSVSLRGYFSFDRHRIPHLGLMDRIWCGYCEWANGTLAWISDIVKEIERRYCPIKNNCNCHCEKAKEWRTEFLDYDHKLAELEEFYFNGTYESISVCEKKEKSPE